MFFFGQMKGKYSAEEVVILYVQFYQSMVLISLGFSYFLILKNWVPFILHSLEVVAIEVFFKIFVL